MENKTIYTLKLHDDMAIRNGEIRVLRVAGGWIYYFMESGVFVPFDNEFDDFHKSKKVS